MNSMVKLAVIAVGAASLFAGCTKSTESEYEDLIRATMKEAPAEVREAKVKEGLERFRKMSPEEQKTELEKCKVFFEGLKGLKK